MAQLFLLTIMFPKLSYDCPRSEKKKMPCSRYFLDCDFVMKAELTQVEVK